MSENNGRETEPKRTKKGTVMTFLASYQAPRGHELRVYDAEFRGKHYFDLRYYAKLRRGTSPTQKGVRLSAASVMDAEDGMRKWKRYVERFGKINEGDAPENED